MGGFDYVLLWLLEPEFEFVAWEGAGKMSSFCSIAPGFLEHI